MPIVKIEPVPGRRSSISVVSMIQRAEKIEEFDSLIDKIEIDNKLEKEYFELLENIKFKPYIKKNLTRKLHTYHEKNFFRVEFRGYYKSKYLFKYLNNNFFIHTIEAYGNYENNKFKVELVEMVIVYGDSKQKIYYLDEEYILLYEKFINNYLKEIDYNNLDNKNRFIEAI